MSPIELTKERGVVLSNVAKTFGDEFDLIPVIHDCSFKIEDGQFTILIGPSGCGKTTLINLIAGYERPTSGRISCDGEEVRGPTRDRLVLFQETSLFPWMSVLQNVMYGPVVQGRKKSAQSEAVELLSKVGLQDFRDKYPNQLSGGMQRRAELARTLINKPAILLGDSLVLLSSAPTSVRECIRVDLPRPRSASMLTTQRYAQLKSKVLAILYQEALQSFASGSRAAADMIEAFELRHQAGEP